MSTEPPFHFVDRTKIPRKGKVPIYAVAFNKYSNHAMPVFATASERKIGVYCCTDKNYPTQVDRRRRFLDTNATESYYTVDWCYDKVQHRSVIIAAGKNASIKVLDPEEGTIVREMFSHGDAINELRTDPNNSMIFASASADFSLRIWCLSESAPLIVCGGRYGHTGQVISCDWSLDSGFLVSSGEDHAIRTWRMDDRAKEIIEEAVDRAILHNWHSSDDEEETDKPAIEKRTPYYIYMPNNLCTDLHKNYVDCVRYLGNYLVSKGCDEMINIFRFGHDDDDPATVYAEKPDEVVSQVRQMVLAESNTWFLKFDISPTNDLLVCGGNDGCLRFFNLHQPARHGYSATLKKENFSLQVCKRAIRQVAFDRTGNHLIVVGDDHSVIRLDRTPLPNPRTQLQQG